MISVSERILKSKVKCLSVNCSPFTWKTYTRLWNLDSVCVKRVWLLARSDKILNHPHHSEKRTDRWISEDICEMCKLEHCLPIMSVCVACNAPVIEVEHLSDMFFSSPSSMCRWSSYNKKTGHSCLLIYKLTLSHTCLKTFTEQMTSTKVHKAAGTSSKAVMLSKIMPLMKATVLLSVQLRWLFCLFLSTWMSLHANYWLLRSGICGSHTIYLMYRSL